LAERVHFVRGYQKEIWKGSKRKRDWKAKSAKGRRKKENKVLGGLAA